MKWSILYSKNGSQQGMLSKAKEEMVEDKYLAYRMLFQLHLLLSAILKCPFDNVGLRRDTLDMLALFNLGPEVMKVLKLDEMPDLGERGGNYRRLCNGG